MNTNDFDFELPEELIAQTPLEQRDASKLLVIDPVTKEMTDTHFGPINRPAITSVVFKTTCRAVNICK